MTRRQIPVAADEQTQESEQIVAVTIADSKAADKRPAAVVLATLAG
jgi:hypothetical protein